MNNPIRTQTRGNKKDRRQQQNGPQSELDEIMSTDQAPLHERTNLDMGDGTVLTSAGSLEEARERPSISAEELMKGNEVVTIPAVERAQEQVLGDLQELSDALPVNEVQRGDDVFFFMPSTEVDKILAAREAGSMTTLSWDELQKFRVEVGTPTTATAEDGQILREQHAEVYGQQESNAGDLYTSKDLCIIVTRYPKNMTEKGQAELRDMLTVYPLAFTGFRTGFMYHKGNQNPKDMLALDESKPELYYAERSGKKITNYFEAWGDKLATLGLNEATTFDFFALDLSDDGTGILTAWKCSGMYPRYLGSIDSSRQAGRSGIETHSFGVGLGGVVTRGHEVMAEAKALLEAQ
jgi:hypothetical protein